TVLPLRNTVLFPSLFMPLAVGRPQSVAAIEAVLGTEEKAFVAVAQRNSTDDAPAGLEALHGIGTRAVVKKMARGEGGIELLVHGGERVVRVRAGQREPSLPAVVRPLPLPEDQGPEVEALHRAVLEQMGKVLELAQPQTPVNLAQIAAQAQDPLKL